ncbi:MAG: nuclear transport factor 2 family protein [Congregibacter sp.]
MFKNVIPALTISFFCLLATGLGADERSDTDAINLLLNDFHLAAAAADEERYLGYFAPNGVFMGTDDWERWPLPEFKLYVAERFEGGVGWNYVPEARNLGFSAQGDTVWFDEIMVSARWGRFRGTGVVTRAGDVWKIAHYSLTALVPNESFQAVSKITRKGFTTRGAAQ